MTTAACPSEDMARLAAAEEATAASAQAARRAAAQMEAATAHEEAEEAKTEAATAHDEAEQAIMDAAAADMRAMDAETALGEAQQEIDDLQDQLDRQAEEAAEYSPTDPGGTLEGVEGRAAAARVAVLNPNPIGLTTVSARTLGAETNIGPDGMRGTADDAPFPIPAAAAGGPIVLAALPRDVNLAGLQQSQLGQPPALTLNVTGGSGLGTAADSASTPAPTIPGWTGVSLERMGPGAITQKAYVYSDAQPSVRAFEDVYEYNTDRVGGGGAVTIPLGSRTHLLVNAYVAAVGGVATTPTAIGQIDPNISFTHGLSATTGVTTRQIVATPAPPAAGAVAPLPAGSALPGSYANVPGVYRCSTICTVSLAADGSTVQFIGGTAAAPLAGNLTFRADDPDTLLPDADWLAFGIWEAVPDSPTLANPGRLRPFVGGNAPVYTFAQVSAAGMRGTATYNGNAVGQYATRDQGSHLAEMGYFTATATVTANFDADSTPLTAAVDGFGLAVSGSITNFVDGDGNPLAGWRVNLNGGGMITGPDGSGAAGPPVVPPVMRARPSTDGDIYGTTSGLGGGATSGSLSWTGIWDAWLFGNGAATGGMPTGIAGRFQASAGSARPVTTAEGRINQFTDTGFAGVAGSFAGR